MADLEAAIEAAIGGWTIPKPLTTASLATRRTSTRVKNMGLCFHERSADVRAV